MATATKKLKPVVDPIVGMVDELGALERWAAVAGKDGKTPASKFSRIDTLRRSLREFADASAASSSFTLPGLKYDALFGAKGDASQVDNAGVAKLIGMDKFISIAKITLEALKEFPGITAQVVSAVFNVGPRSLKTFEKSGA